MPQINDYIRVVRKERPVLSDIIDEFGELDVLSFSKQLFKKGEIQSAIYRSEFIDLLKLTFPETPKKIIDQLDVSLKKNPVASTADHHCIINHPVYLNSNILLSLFAGDFSQKESLVIAPPVLSFSAIPLNNTAYPRGFLLASPQGEKRFSFIGSKKRHRSIYAADPLVFSDGEIDRWIKNNGEKFTKKEIGLIEKFLLELMSNTGINDYKSYSDQIDVINRWIWSQFFPETELRFFPIEKITKKFFEETLFKNRDLPIYDFFFNMPCGKQDQLFNGIYGAWDLDKLESWKYGGGTSFFWGINSEKRMIALKREKGFLMASDKNFNPVKWKLEDIIEALKKNRIVPSILTNYLIVAGHYGIYCSGAFNQIGYLSPILKQYQKGLLTISKEESERIGKVLSGGVHAFLYFLFGETKKKVVPLCSLNILQQKEKIEAIPNILKKVTLNEVFNITAPLIFPFIVEPEIKDKMSFSFDNVLKELKKSMPKQLIFQKW